MLLCAVWLISIFYGSLDETDSKASVLHHGIGEQWNLTSNLTWNLKDLISYVYFPSHRHNKVIL